MDPNTQDGVEIPLGLQAGADALDVPGRLGEQPLDQLSRVPGVGPGRDELRLPEQIVELQRELRGVVTLPVERECLGENGREALAVVPLEANLPGVERKREPERDVQPLDP